MINSTSLNSALVAQPDRTSWTKEKGWTIVKVWEGFEGVIDSAITTLQSTSYNNISKRCIESLWFELTAQSPDATEPEKSETIWTIKNKHSAKSLLHDSEDPLVVALSPSNRDILEYAIKHIEEYQKTGWQPMPYDVDGNQPDMFYELWENIAAGYRDNEIEQPILRGSYVAPYAYIISGSMANVGCVYTTTALTNEQDIDEGIIDCMPTQSGSVIPEGCDYLTLNYGWLKHKPDVEASSTGKRQVSQEWEWGLWSNRKPTITS